MEVERGQRILINFVDFYLEGNFLGDSCPYDYVRIQDDDGTILLDKTCSSNKPPDIVSRTNRAEVIFRTDSSVQFRGWKLQFGRLPDCIVLDPGTGSWVPGLRPLTFPRLHSSVITSDLGVYIIGGTSSPYTSEFLPWTTSIVRPTTTTTTTTTTIDFFRRHGWFLLQKFQ